ncbi:MAG TPA: N-acetylmuramoyl-L-alanine amidase [Bacteroidia bacterium]|jgi:N-acetylmuramoyl-L-alanine amidase|nr:N-acetylmuramoyl-L-alanine amidase [Bacteroidia bacterium]
MNLYNKQVLVFARLTIVLSTTFLLCGAVIPKTKPKGVKTIVIDPGHGGKDPGCNGALYNEKDIALSIALKLGELIEKNLKDVKVIYTRKTDVFVELEARAQIANTNEADLFISIHCNAASVYATYKDKKGKIHFKTYKDKKGKTRKVEIHNPKPYGSATYVMGISNEKGKLNTAKRENASMLMEDNYEKKYNGFDPESDEAYIIMSLWTGAFVEQSASLASKIQNEYTGKAGRIDKGVQRQSIWVLWRTAMPSILTEVGFLTNPEEEKFLGSEKGQVYMASALFRATRKYKDEQEGQIKKYDDEIEKQEAIENENLTKGNSNEDSETGLDSTKAADLALDEQFKTVVKEADDKFKTKNYEEAKKLYEKANELRPEEKYPPFKMDECKKKLAQLKTNETEEEKIKKEQSSKYRELVNSGDKFFAQGKWKVAITQYQQAYDLRPEEYYPKQKIKEAEEKEKNDKLKKAEAEAKTPVKKDTVAVTPKSIIDTYKDNTPKTVKKEIVFKVQFASQENEPDLKTAKYKDVSEADYYKSGNIYKITSGNFLNPDDAVNLQNKMRKEGYKDCFVIALKNGKRVDYKEAVKEIQP